jgi:outer membrane autotransporter protein
LAVDDFENSIRNKSLWMQAIGSIGEQKNHNEHYGYNLNSNGFMIGGDKQFFDNSRLGVAVAYISSDAKSKSENTKKTAIETYQLSLYGDYNLGKYFVDGTAGVGFNRYHSSRIISSQSLVARADYNGETYFASANAGFKQEFPFDLTLTPKAGLTYSRNNIDPYSESGAGNLGLTVNNIGSDFLEGKIGADLGYKTTNYKEFNFDPKLTLTLGYDFIYDRQNTYSNFIGYPSNVVNAQADKVQRRSLKLGAEVNIYKVKELSFGAGYNLEIRDQYQAHFGSLDAKYQF